MQTPCLPIPRLLEGRLALVTGAGRGNGRAIALGLARAGARVVVTDLDATGARATAEQIRTDAGQAWPHALDVTDPHQCQALARQVRSEAGRVDLLVNNAGIIIREGTDTHRAPENWRRTIDVNLHGTFNVTYAWLPDLKATHGTIVNIASIAAYAGQGGSLGYSPSKGAIKMFTQSLAAELAVHGVRVNALAPGVIETPMTAPTRQDPQRLERFMSRIPMGRLGQPEELVGPVVFLSSGLASYVTGVTLPVDGGFLAV
ncbi:SDR family NAD(P)-dependent oxidoreductase [Caldimonas sp.]|uniref:SDR family NAD(P)-dependent oxidoreductase n=1 Tax=Caldimonas sp. TaxID=2838790 RepID=UPI00391BFA03